MTSYAELRLRIDRGVARGSYRVVATGPAGEALGRFKLPFSDIELENFILKIGSTRRGRRRIDSPEMELAKTFGTKLFGALFEGDVRELYRSSFTETRGDGLGLRVTLALTGAPELLQVPWEYLYDHPSFLSISTWTPIVRYLDLPKPRRPLQITLPLRILALVSAPTDFEVIDAGLERTKLESALAPLIASGAIAIDWLEEASLRALQRQLRKADYHVFHYIGHGGYDQDADDGILLFEDETGRGRRVSGVQLGTILADEVSLRLAVLNSCEGGRSSLQDPFSGVATSLIEREIPAVIGMQFEITDRAAIVFAGEFYSALADGLPVDSSVAEARKAIYADQNDIEWGTPVLFMRVVDGRLFDVAEHAPVRPVAPERESGPTSAAGAMDAAATSEAARVAAAAAASAAAERERAEAAEAERVEAERVATVAEAERVEAERVEAERVEAERAEAERMAAAAEVERVKAERLEAERVTAERVEAERVAAEVERIEAERAEAERAEAERAEAERIERERLQREADELAERDRAAAAALALSRQAAEVAAADERARAGATEAEPAQQERLQHEAEEAAERERAAQAEVDRIEAELDEARRVERERLDEEAKTSPTSAPPDDAWVSEEALLAPAAASGREGDGPVQASVGVGPAAVASAAVTGAPRVAITSDTDVTVLATSGIPPWLRRTAGRAAFGSFLGLAFVWIWVYLAHPDYFGDDTFERAFGWFLIEAALTMIVIGGAVVAVEAVSPSVRVPGGGAFRSVGGNRWAAAAVQGAVAGVVVGFPVTVWLYWTVRDDSKPFSIESVLLHGTFTALGFVLAEATIRRLRPDTQQGASRPVSSSVLRAASRGGLGGALAIIVSYPWFYLLHPDVYRPDKFDNIVARMVGEAVLIGITLGLAVALAEDRVPAVRVPGGSAYRIVGGNRWAAAAIQGAVAGALVFALDVLHDVILVDYAGGFTPEHLLEVALLTASMFVIAEAVLDRRPSHRLAEEAPT